MSDPFSFLSTPGPTQTTTQSGDPFIMPFWQQYVNQGMNTIAQNPITPYGGPTVMPQTFMQQTANDMGYNLATGGSPAGNMANSAIIAQASGANLANPYATTMNPYMGTNPYTQQVIDPMNQAMADAYAKGTAAQTAAAFNMNNAFGGSAYQDTMAQNNQAFANSVAQADSQLLNQNFYNNSNLAENAINRATNSYDSALDNQLQAAQLGLASSNQDWNAINNLYALGSGQQQYGQNVLNAGANYYNQVQQQPFINLDLMGNLLSNYSNANRTTTTQGPDSSGLMNLLGLLGLGGTLFG